MLRAVLYSEFDPIAGPKLSHQVPEGTMGKETFEAITDYIITKPQLCGKLISMTACGMKVMGFPVCLEHNKFARNALWFNVCFVFDPDADVSVYKPVLRKLANIFIALECESEFLSHTATGDRLRKLLEQIFTDLNSRGGCCIPIDEANTIYLQLFPKRPPPPEVYPHQVPVRIKDLDPLMTRDWDLTVQQVVPYIDGVRYVKKIARESGVHIDLVRQCMKHLLYYECITMIDIFQYSNVYVCTPRIQELYGNRAMQNECRRYVTLPGTTSPPFERLFALYCGLRPALTFRDFCQDNDIRALNIDDRKLVTFGLINGFLRRVHKYPVYSPPNPLLASAQPKNRLPKYIRDLVDGSHSFDEICCELGKSYEEVRQMLETAQNYTTIFK
jgi:hypothetical protein